MHQMSKLISAELRKTSKSKVIWITFIAFTILPVIGSFFMFVLKHPNLAENWGLIGEKAQLAGKADWPSYLGFLAQGISIGGIFVYGFMTSWIFGREYMDRTVKDLLALPFPRIYVPMAKFVVIFIWSFIVTIWIIGLGIFLGFIIGLGGWSTEVWQHGINVLIIASILTIILSTPVAFFACYGHGYLASIGFVIITIVMSQIIAAIGYGDYFPWAIPALFSNVSGEGNILEPASVFIVLITSLLGFFSTLSFWRFADQNV
ncbi:ABC transporter permease [Cytobacillus sp. Hz8]|uniref:ABC transporter permease n=1 Tax=Cytobacillus sp. Hz8 TaxID=3347168 RepID=UPI0035E37418